MESSLKLAAGSTPSPLPLLDLARENDPLTGEFMEQIARVVMSGQFVLGPEVTELENQIAERCQTRCAVACASGSDAILLCLMAAKIQPGDEVILPSFTFFSTASAVWRLGGVPVFVDVDPQTFNLDTDHFLTLITDRTKAVIPVHLFGQCANMAGILEIASQHGLTVIEDCAQSIDACFHGQPAGSMGLAGCFSFYPTKNLGGFGDSGMITTNDEEFAEQLRLFRVHGMSPRYIHHVVGINSRLDTVQAAILLTKLQHLRTWTAQRRNNATRYEEMFTASPIGNRLGEQIVLPRVANACESVWNQYTIRVPGGHRNPLRSELTQSGIGSEIYYPLPLHRQPCFASLGYKKGDIPATDMVADQVLSLPIFPAIEAAEQQRVVDCIAGYMRGLSATTTPMPTHDTSLHRAAA